MENELILVIDFYSQFNQLITRRIRECNVYAEIVPHNTPLEEIKAKNPKGIVLTGGPSSVYAQDAMLCDKGVFELGIPVLGICYGMQTLAHLMGGKVEGAGNKEYGVELARIKNECPLFKGYESTNRFLMSHFDKVTQLPHGFDVIASTDNTPIAGIANEEKKLYGLQFHPEVELSENGIQIFKNFLFDICGCSGDWAISAFVENKIAEIKAQVGDKKALCALSGGVDSSVAAELMSRAIGNNLTCIFVDHGLLRKNEVEEVEQVFANRENINFVKVDARERFLSKLKGVREPETKRKIIGEEFIRVFEDEAKKIGAVDYLVQGTIYPDCIESGVGSRATIKSHHNVGGLPDHVDFDEIIEPLRNLFKDEVRAVGTELGLPDFLVHRQPFPGPGLAIRVISDITEEKLDILKEADYIFREEISKAGLEGEMSQYFAVLTDVRSVGVMGDERTYDYMVALRSVKTSDFMTASWVKIPYEVLEKVSSRIVNEVKNVNRVVYDITSKPPATIEWE